MKIILSALAIALLSTQAMAQALTDIPSGAWGTPSSVRFQSVKEAKEGQCLKASDVDAGVYRWVDCNNKNEREELEKAHDLCIKKYYSPGSTQLGVKPGWSFPECETIDQKWKATTKAEEMEIIKRAAKQ